MIVKFGRFGWKAVLIWMECLAVIVGLVLLAGGVFLWRLGTGPLDAGFARETIEEALRDPVSGYSVTMEGITLEWPDIRGPVTLTLDDVGLVRDGNRVLGIGKVGLGISAGYLLRGKIKPVTISLAHSSLHLIRTNDNRVVLSLEDMKGDETPSPDQADDNPLMRVVNILSYPEGTINERSPIDRLRAVKISDATMVMEDHVLGISWYLRDTDLAFSRDDKGLVVETSVMLPGGRDKAAKLWAGAIYNRDDKIFKINAHVQDIDPRIVSRKVDALSFLDGQEIFLSGSVDLVMNTDLEIQAAAGKLFAEDGMLNIEGVYNKPISYQKIALEAVYDPDKRTVNVKEVSLRAYDVDISANSIVTLDENKIAAPLKIKIPSLPQERIKYLWPDVLHGKPIESWLLQRLSKGSVDNISAGLTIAAVKDKEEWRTDVSGITAAFDIVKMDVDYRSPLAPAKHTSGHGKLENDIITISIDGAHVDDMTISSGTVVIDNVTSDKVGHAKINVALQGGLPSLFKYISTEPIGMKGDDLGIDTANVLGDALLDVNVSFPTLRDLPKDKVEVTAQGTLDNVLLPDVLKSLDLTGGPMKLAVMEGKVKLSGAGKLDGRPVKLAWEQFLESKGKPYSSKIKAELDVDKDLRRKLGVGIDDWLAGTVPVKIDYTEFQNGGGEIAVAGDLKAAAVIVEPFKYIKPPGQAGTVTCTAVLHGGFVQEIRDLNVKTPDLNIVDGLIKFETIKGESVLRRGNFARMKLNETDAILDFEIGKNEELKIGLRGTFFDARPFLNKGDKKDRNAPYEGPAVIASVDVAKMRSSDTHTLDKVKIYLNLNRKGMVDQIELDAIAGKGAVYLRMKPDTDRNVNVFQFEADDAGAALNAFGVYKNIRGGTLAMKGESTPGKSRYVINGKAQLSDFNVVNAPTLAVLVSAISPTGLPQLLSNDGLFFSRLESKFQWRLRRSGDVYIVRDGRTSGSSLGLTFEGEVNKGKNVVDINGHVVPMSEINSLLSSIPLLGQLLSGGSDGGIFAATYTMTGSADKPKVSINPLSVLTPGIIRRILFED